MPRDKKAEITISFVEDADGSENINIRCKAVSLIDILSSASHLMKMVAEREPDPFDERVIVEDLVVRLDDLITGLVAQCMCPACEDKQNNLVAEGEDNVETKH